MSHQKQYSDGRPWLVHSSCCTAFFGRSTIIGGGFRWRIRKNAWSIVVYCHAAVNSTINRMLDNREEGAVRRWEHDHDLKVLLCERHKPWCAFGRSICCAEWGRYRSGIDGCCNPSVNIELSKPQFAIVGFGCCLEPAELVKVRQMDVVWPWLWLQHVRIFCHGHWVFGHRTLG